MFAAITENGADTTRNGCLPECLREFQLRIGPAIMIFVFFILTLNTRARLQAAFPHKKRVSELTMQEFQQQLSGGQHAIVPREHRLRNRKTGLQAR